MGKLDTYNNLFYRNQLTESKNSAQVVIPIINNWFQPKSVIDVGCGVGAWLEVWKNFSNIQEVKGIDSDFVDKSLLLIDEKLEFIQTDLNKKLPKTKNYDLAMCLEVAEHLNEKRAESFVYDLTKLSNVIIFSAAIPGQEGTHHINEQYLGYWVEKFKQYNYKCYDVIRPLVWDNRDIAWWFRQNIIVFVKKADSDTFDLSKLQSFNCKDLVCKELLEHKIKKYNKLVNRKTSFKSLLKEIYNIIIGKIYERKKLK